MSWLWLLPLGLGACSAGGLLVALRLLRRETRGLAAASATLGAVADHARGLR